MIHTLPGLNYDKDDLKFILLGKVFKFIENEKLMDEYNRCGIHNRSLFLICLKIFFMHAFFSYIISGVVYELNRQLALRNFARISYVQVKLKFMSISADTDQKTYCEIANAILRKLYTPHKSRKDTYITDATPVKCDINVIKKYIIPEHLKKLKLKWGYSTTNGDYIGYKVTVVLEKTTKTPVSILIHPGSPNDTKIFDEVLKELKRRRLIKPKDIIYFNKGYFSHKNYEIGINKYKIIPVIFPKKAFKINKFKDRISYLLSIYKNEKEFAKNKKLIEHLERLLPIKLENWKEYKQQGELLRISLKLLKEHLD